MKRIVRTVCTGCHTASFPLQHRFDEAGWNAIIELMKNANVYGTYRRRRAQAVRHSRFHQKELAAYLAQARGPGGSDMRVKLEPRPSGEAARAMFKEYDVPLDPDSNLPANFVQNDGSDWSLGTPSVLIPGWGVHDSWLDLTGNLWFTCNIPNKRTTIGRIDTTTGEVKLFKVAGPNGLAAQTHGMTRDPNGIIWFNINNGRGGIGRLDPATAEDQSLPAAERHDPDRRRRHGRLRRQRQYLVVGARRRAALRSGRGEIHRVQIDDLQDRERHRRHLRHRRRPRRQRLLGRDGARHHRRRRRRLRRRVARSSCRRTRSRARCSPPTR